MSVDAALGTQPSNLTTDTEPGQLVPESRWDKFKALAQSAFSKIAQAWQAIKPTVFAACRITVQILAIGALVYSAAIAIFIVAKHIVPLVVLPLAAFVVLYYYPLGETRNGLRKSG